MDPSKPGSTRPDTLSLCSPLPENAGWAVTGTCRPKCTAAEWNWCCVSSGPQPSEGLATAASALWRVLSHCPLWRMEGAEKRVWGRKGGTGTQAQPWQHSRGVLLPLRLQTGKWTFLLELSSPDCNYMSGASKWKKCPTQPQSIPRTVSKQDGFFKPLHLGVVYYITTNHQTLWSNKFNSWLSALVNRVHIIKTTNNLKRTSAKLHPHHS